VRLALWTKVVSFAGFVRSTTLSSCGRAPTRRRREASSQLFV